MKPLTKTFTKTFTSALLLATTLVGCGTQPQVNALIPTKMKQTQQNQRVRSYYVFGEVESSNFDPDTNGNHFGYDFHSLQYKTFWPDDQQRLNISHSTFSNHAIIHHTTKLGTPEEKEVRISTSETKKLQELSFFLGTVRTTNAKDAENLGRVIQVLSGFSGSSTEFPGLTPVQVQSLKKSMKRRSHMTRR